MCREQNNTGVSEGQSAV